MENSNTPNRDYNSISPSARAILLMKGHTDIPYAKEVASLIMHPDTYTPDFNNTDLNYWLRVAHFESRYKSIDTLLGETPAKNILELSSGFSFRGLAITQQQDVHYIDTDLPAMIDQKKAFLATLQQNAPETAGKLELLPLNALDEPAFKAIISRFKDGEIVFVNEGLLMYLDLQEKQQLCSLIHSTLIERGGYWITADIYTRLQGTSPVKMNDQLQKFFDQHNIEENKFESFEAAEAFFKQAGFVIDQEAVPDYSHLTAIPYVMKNATPELLAGMGKNGRMHTTWKLKAVPLT